MFLNIEDGAIFVADSHFNEIKPEFLIFLKKVKNKEIKTTQLFLLGDMFDFISGESKYFIKRNQELLDIINELSSEIQIVYLEGNHDYNMQALFNNVLVIKREEQPLQALYNRKSVSISHGDNFTPWHYNLFCTIIRSHLLLKFLNIIDINNFISKTIYYFLIKKDICSKMEDFNSFAKRRINNYNSDIIIEGHFHQGKEFSSNEQFYINIPSLVCDKRYIVLDNEQFRGEHL